MPVMRALLYVFFIAVMSPAVAFAQAAPSEEKLTIVTYYPSPSGVYATLRLVPNAAPGACDAGVEGKMYFNQTVGTLDICSNTAGVWSYKPIAGSGGLWALTGTNLTSANTTWSVGIGTAAPATGLHVSGGNDLAALITSQNTAMAGRPFIQLGMNQGNNAGLVQATAGKDIKFWNGQYALTILGSNGYVGIGTNAPASTLEVEGNITAIDNVTASAFLYSSDRALKTNIRPASNSLEKILSLAGKTFNWKKDGRQDMGLIAQDVERVYPELVSTNPVTGLKSVEYANLIAPLIEAIKEQQRQIETLKDETARLRSKVR